MLKPITIALGAGFAVVSIAAVVGHVAAESEKSETCKQKESVERAMVMCAATPKCMLTLSDIEHLVDIHQACTRR